MGKVYAIYAAEDRLRIILKDMLSFETVTNTELRCNEYLTNNCFRRCMLTFQHITPSVFIRASIEGLAGVPNGNIVSRKKNIVSRKNT